MDPLETFFTQFPEIFPKKSGKRSEFAQIFDKATAPEEKWRAVKEFEASLDKGKLNPRQIEALNWLFSLAIVQDPSILTDRERVMENSVLLKEAITSSDRNWRNITIEIVYLQGKNPAFINAFLQILQLSHPTKQEMESVIGKGNPVEFLAVANNLKLAPPLLHRLLELSFRALSIETIQKNLEMIGNIEELDLSGIHREEAIATILPEVKGLKKLSLRKCKIGIKLAEVLGRMTGLEVLCIAQNRIDEKWIDAFAKGLGPHHQLKDLDVSVNLLGNKRARKLLEALAPLRKLRNINMRHNLITENGFRRNLNPEIG